MILLIFETQKLQVKKETLLAPEELRQFQNHSSQMAALDFMVSVASSTFIPTYDGNMAKVVEGHRRFVYPPLQRYKPQIIFFWKIWMTYLNNRLQVSRV